MKSEETTAKPLVVSILSLSLLTVMAGAAVAPALGVIQEYFADSSPVLVQMIISIPAIFIVITNSIFPRLCKRFGAKVLTIDVYKRQEYHFLRKLVDDNLIPDDVTIQVLTQSRKHIIKKTFDSLAGVKKAVVHLYNSTSLAQREQVFRKEKQMCIRDRFYTVCPACHCM